MNALDRYTETFGNPKKTIENLPYQLTVECNMNPHFLSEDTRIKSLFERCLERGRAFTEREFVECLFFVDGVYTNGSVSSKDYDKFVKMMDAFDADY